MLGLVDGGDELLAPRLDRRVVARVAAGHGRVVVVVGVDDAEPVGQVAQVSGQALVGGHRVRPDRVPAHRRDDDRVQQGEGGRPVDERHVGVPVVGADAPAGVDFLQVGLVGRRRQRRVAQRERAEALGERDLPGVVEALVAQEDHLVVEQRLAHLRDLVVAEGAAGVDAADLRTDVTGEPGHGNAGLAGDGVGHGGAFRLSERMRAWPAGRAESAGTPGELGEVGREGRISAGGEMGEARPSGGRETERAGHEDHVHVAALGPVVGRHGPSMARC